MPNDDHECAPGCPCRLGKEWLQSTQKAITTSLAELIEEALATARSEEGSEKVSPVSVGMMVMRLALQSVGCSAASTAVAASASQAQIEELRTLMVDDLVNSFSLGVAASEAKLGSIQTPSPPHQGGSNWPASPSDPSLN